MIETAVVSAIGATVSILDAGGSSYIKLCRIWAAGFFLAFFAGNDVANFIQHLFNFQISKGGTLFLVAVFGSACIEKILFFIKSFKLSILGYKK